MSHIDNVRKEIERILNCRFSTQFVEKTEKGNHVVRLSPYVKNSMSEKQKNELRKIPHFVKYTETFGFDYSAINIYFDCKPSEIKIPCKS